MPWWWCSLSGGESILELFTWEQAQYILTLQKMTYKVIFNSKIDHFFYEKDFFDRFGTKLPKNNGTVFLKKINLLRKNFVTDQYFEILK